MPVADEGNGDADDDIDGSSSLMSDSSDSLLARDLRPRRLKVQKKMKEERRLKGIQEKMKMKEERRLKGIQDKKIKLLETNHDVQHLELLNSQRLARAAMFKRHQTERVRLGLCRLYENKRPSTTQEHIDRCRRR